MQQNVRYVTKPSCNWGFLLGISVAFSSQGVRCRWRGEVWRPTCPNATSAAESVPTAVVTLSTPSINRSTTVWQSCAWRWTWWGLCPRPRTFPHFDTSLLILSFWVLFVCLFLAGRRCCARWRRWDERWSLGWTPRGDTWCRKSRNWRVKWRSSRWNTEVHKS